MRNEKRGRRSRVDVRAARRTRTLKAQIINALGQQGGGCKQLVDIDARRKRSRAEKGRRAAAGNDEGSKEATDYLMELINK